MSAGGVLLDALRRETRRPDCANWREKLQRVVKAEADCKHHDMIEVGLIKPRPEPRSCSCGRAEPTFAAYTWRRLPAREAIPILAEQVETDLRETVVRRQQGRKELDPVDAILFGDWQFIRALALDQIDTPQCVAILRRAVVATIETIQREV